MFARQGCDSAAGVRGSASAAVAKLQRARDSLIGLSIRGMDEHATHRRRGPQLQGQGRGNRLGPAVRVLVPPPGLHPDLGRPGSRSRRTSLCRSARPSSPSPPAAATRCPISRRGRRRSMRSTSTRRISRCCSSSSRGFVLSPATPNSGSSSARPPRSPTRRSIAIGCGRCWTRRRAPTGTGSTSSAARVMPISPTGFIATACSAASSVLPMCWRNWRGSILSALLNGKVDSPERIRALDRLHRLFHSPLARLITATPALLFSLGIPPQQRALLGADAPLNEVLHERLLRLVNGHPNETNYFAWQALQRSYRGPGRCLPAALSAARPVRTHARRRRIDHSGARQSPAVSRRPSGARGRCRGAAGLAGLDGLRRDPRALECDRPHRQRQRPRHLPHRRQGISAGE